eukprot:3941040-Rhodomonas_salina.1
MSANVGCGANVGWGAARPGAAPFQTARAALGSRATASRALLARYLLSPSLPLSLFPCLPAFLLPFLARSLPPLSLTQLMVLSRACFRPTLSAYAHSVLTRARVLGSSPTHTRSTDALYGATRRGRTRTCPGRARAASARLILPVGLGSRA